jgi:hypothetical protein
LLHGLAFEFNLALQLDNFAHENPLSCQCYRRGQAWYITLFVLFVLICAKM